MKGKSIVKNQNRSYVVCLADFFRCSCAFVVEVLNRLISGLWDTDRLGGGVALDDVSALLH